MDFLIRIDRYVTYVIHELMRNPIFDVLMPILSDSRVWAVPLLLSLVALGIWGGKKGRVVIVVLIVAVCLSDYITSSILKPFFARPRPMSTSLTSFPSSHAANMFTMAFVVSYYWRHGIVITSAFVLAGLVAFSRVYVGAHYVADVTAGALSGVVYAALAMVIWREIEKRIDWRRRRNAA